MDENAGRLLNAGILCLLLPYTIIIMNLNSIPSIEIAIPVTIFSIPSVFSFVMAFAIQLSEYMGL